MTLLEAKTALCARLNIDYSKIAQNELFSDSDLSDLIQSAVQTAWAYRLWDFTTDALKFHYVSGSYFDYPNTFEDRSIWLLTVEDEEWAKTKFKDYKRYLKNNPDATDEIWSEFKRQYHLNTNALTAGDEICVYGKLRAPTLSAAGDLLPFSPENDNDENSGNRAIIDFAYAEALASDKKKAYGQAETEKKKAYEKLDILWAPMDERDAVAQHHDRAFFENVPDFFATPNSRSTPIGNFE